MMDLRASGRSQRNFRISGWNTATSAWDVLSQRGNLSPVNPALVSTDASRKRALLCSPEDRLPANYSLLSIDYSMYLIASEQRNTWRGGTYQIAYQLLLADKFIDIYRMVATTMASGLPGKAVRTKVGDTFGSVVFASDLPSSKLDNIDYTRAKVYIPGNVSITADDEFEIDTEAYDVSSVRLSQRVKVTECVRR